MDDPNNKPKDQSKPEPKPPIAGEQFDPPPDPRGAGDSSSSLESSFDPTQVSIEEDHEDAFGENAPKKDGSGSASELQISPPVSGFKRFITRKKLWIFLILALFALAVALWFVRDSRVFIANALGLRQEVTVTTRTVAEADQPSALLQKTTVKLNDLESQSDDQGQARFSAKYGQADITAEKPGYEAVSRSEFYDLDPFFGLAGNKSPEEKQVELRLKGVGISIKFEVLDWLTEKPITSGEFEVGDAVAAPDEQGIVSLKVPPTDAKTVSVRAKAQGYVEKTVELKIQEDPVQKLAMVPEGKEYFISNRTGQLGVYSSDLDGGNIKEVVAPSENETSAADFAISPSGKYGVLASTREAKRDSSNNLLQKLYVVNISDGSLVAVDEGLWFDFVDWSGESLAYTTSTSSGAQTLASVDASRREKTTLDGASSFGQIRLSLGKAIYILNHAAGSESAGNNPELRVVPVEGGATKNIGNKVNAVTQSDYDKIIYRTDDNVWHEYNLNTSTASNSSAPSGTSRIFLNGTSADGQFRLLVDKINDANTLIAKSIATGEETKMYSVSGLTRPVRWSTNLVVFRVLDDGKSADYVMALTTQNPKKITDVATGASPQSSSYFGFY